MKTGYRLPSIIMSMTEGLPVANALSTASLMSSGFSTLSLPSPIPLAISDMSKGVSKLEYKRFSPAVSFCSKISFQKFEYMDGPERKDLFDGKSMYAVSFIKDN